MIKIKGYKDLEKEYDLYELYTDFLIDIDVDNSLYEEIREEYEFLLLTDYEEDLTGVLQTIREFYSPIFKALDNCTYESIEDFEEDAIDVLYHSISEDLLLYMEGGE